MAARAAPCASANPAAADAVTKRRRDTTGSLLFSSISRDGCAVMFAPPFRLPIVFVIPSRMIRSRRRCTSIYGTRILLIYTKLPSEAEAFEKLRTGLAHRAAGGNMIIIHKQPVALCGLTARCLLARGVLA